MEEANILQGPPVEDSQYLYNDVFFNPFVIQIINASVKLSMTYSASAIEVLTT
jgi:hypothetical protein